MRHALTCVIHRTQRGLRLCIALRGTGDIEAMLWIGILALQCIPYTASILCQIAAYLPERTHTTPEGTPPADAPTAQGAA